MCPLNETILNLFVTNEIENFKKLNGSGDSILNNRVLQIENSKSANKSKNLKFLPSMKQKT